MARKAIWVGALSGEMPIGGKRKTLRLPLIEAARLQSGKSEKGIKEERYFFYRFHRENTQEARKPKRAHASDSI